MAKNNGWIVIVAIVIIGFLLVKYNPGLFSTVGINTYEGKTIYESSTCYTFLATIKNSGWSYSCDPSKDNCDIHFSDANLLWKEKGCIHSMDDENNKCKIVYSEGAC